MKHASFVILLSLFGSSANAQFGVSIHQSNLPFAGVNYEIRGRLLPELRVGTDNYFDDTTLEFTVSYIFKKTEQVNAYVGLGARTYIFEGVVLPLGLNIYPFESKNFGFQMELAGLFSEGALLRGSWGLRYRFSKE